MPFMDEPSARKTRSLCPSYVATAVLQSITKFRHSADQGLAIWQSQIERPCIIRPLAKRQTRFQTAVGVEADLVRF